MTGGFCLIDYIFDLFLGKSLENTWKTDRVAWDNFYYIWIRFCKKIEEVYNSLNGQVQAFFNVMSSFVIWKKHNVA